ncbi:hypothetical protein CYLTODRAFT_418153 [Cylindrobasidium torrendii FP15055 ss-10]|uniref:Peptidase C14 caspase domain-containing protein n=1 Tax=Cylindrobasidium torrendii FP15055 ss-10 TaxID=1314674 RepID=A0A0D7BRF1_9AGAR|nr:hypothetical protein CYLTODRAFT_418153 [Cylindrobasidium torrendii FP15055 ss-10]
MSLLLPGANLVFNTIRDLVWYIGSHFTNEKFTHASPPKEVNGEIQPPTIERTVGVPLEVLTAPTAFFAVVIGINEYKNNLASSFTNLRGCVSDANDMSKFLQHSLGVPRDQITNLRNSEATRHDIITAIKKLANDTRIEWGDPILIYYAGHGAEAKDENNQPIQMLLPYDFMPETTDDPCAQGIHDYDLGRYLGHIAHRKGDNITVILDSCHSGSGTRDAQAASSDAVRGIDLPDTYKVIRTAGDLDLEVGGDRQAVISPGRSKLGLRSHVLLAATSSSGLAREIQGRGAFTRVLLELFNQFSPDTLTYSDAILRLPDMPSQFPQCEGLNASRILFNGRAPKTDRQLYRVICKQTSDGESTSLLLEAGEAQGIAHGAKFNLYSSRNVDAPVYATARVEDPRACTSVLVYCKPPTSTPALTMWALQTYVGDNVQNISVALPLDLKLVPLIRKVMENMNDRRRTKRNITLVDPKEPHILSLRYDEPSDSIFIDINDDFHGVRTIQRSISLSAGFEDDMILVLSSAADFFYHLNRSCMKADLDPLSKEVTLEAHVLDVGSLRPTGENLLKTNPGTLELVASPHIAYGFTIINNSDKPLYAWVLLFEMSDLSIELIYGSNFAKAADGKEQLALDASIPAHDKLTLGYGSGGAQPLGFEISSDAVDELSYLKIFLTTRPIDLSFVPQTSPFDLTRKGFKLQMLADQWDALKLAILVRRPPATSKGSQKVDSSSIQKVDSSSIQPVGSDVDSTRHAQLDSESD